MRQYWRIQQSQTLISMAFWCTTLTLLIWPLVSWRFEEMDTIMGIPSTYLGLLGIFATVLAIVLSIGWMYDVSFGLWREHLTVVQERNPFTTYKLNAPFGIILSQTNTILRKVSEDDEAPEDADASESAAEEAAHYTPDLRWVAGLHTLSARDLLKPTSSLDTDAIICGDDNDAKSTVSELLSEVPGLRPVDAGSLQSARYLEGATALLININKRYKSHASLTISGLNVG